MAVNADAAPDIYDTLWIEGATALARGQPEIDPWLSDRSNDLRRCITLSLRPSPEVQAKVEDFQREAALTSPSQHFYRANELHVTVLSVNTQFRIVARTTA